MAKKRLKVIVDPVPEQEFHITRDVLEEIEILSGRGLTNEHLYKYYGIKRDKWFELRKNHEELDMAYFRGKSKTIAFVTGKLMEKIKNGDITAIIFFLKTQAKWFEHRPYYMNQVAEGEQPVHKQYTISTKDPVEAAKVYQQFMSEGLSNERNSSSH